MSSTKIRGKKLSGHQNLLKKAKLELEKAANKKGQRKLFELDRRTSEGLPTTQESDGKRSNSSQSNDAYTNQKSEDPPEVNLNRSTSTSSNPMNINIDEEDSTDDELFILIEPASLSSKLHFMSHHPIQPINHQLWFDYRKVYYQNDRSGNHQLPCPRKWISYSQKRNTFFCAPCACFASLRESPFIKGVEYSIKNLYGAINAHERCNSHQESVANYFQANQVNNSCGYLNAQQLVLRQKEIHTRKEILKRIISVVILIGKQGLSYRGTTEAIYTLEDKSANHGNFLEILKMTAEWDPQLRDYLASAIQNSISRKALAIGTNGRGEAVSLLSKTTFNNILQIIRGMIREKVVSEVLRSQTFSIQLDSTQDVSTVEQCCIVIRYVDNKGAKERLLSMMPLENQTGEGYLEFFNQQLKNYGLSKENLVACSFDGASSMRGQNRGLQARLRVEIPNLVYTWCYAHSTNLVVTSAIEGCQVSRNFIGLLTETCNFFSDSNYRMQEWKKSLARRTGNIKLAKLVKIGSTRWWSTDKAVRRIFGSYHSDTKEEPLFSNLIESLHTISESSSSDAKTSHKAKCLIENWLKFQNVLTGFVLLRLFGILTPLSQYVQSTSVDFLIASTMVSNASEKIKDMEADFQDTLRKAEKFVKRSQKEIECVVNYEIERSLPIRRHIHPKRRLCEDEDTSISLTSLSEIKKYEESVYIPLCETAVGQMTDKYQTDSDLLQQLSIFQPEQFSKLINMQNCNLSRVCKVMTLNCSDVLMELEAFVKLFTSIKSAAESQDNVNIPPFEISEDSHESSSSESDEASTLTGSGNTLSNVRRKCSRGSGWRCFNCCTCCYLFLYEYRMHCSSFPCLSSIYKFILLLPCTQVSCERTFSKLKFVKNRLRNQISDDNLEAFLLMSVEREITSELSYDEIAEKLAKSSRSYARYLT